MNKIAKLLSTGLIFCVSQLSAQVKTAVFKEFDADDYLNNSLSLGKQGVLMYGWEENTVFVARHLDTNLEEKNTWKVTTEKYARLADIAWQESKDRIIVFFRVRANECRMVNIQLGNQDFASHDLKFPTRTFPVFKLLPADDEIWFKSSAKGGVFIQKLNINSGDLSILNLAFGDTKKKPSVISMELISKNEIAIVHQYGPRKKRELDVKIFNFNGDVVLESVLFSLDADRRNSMLNATITQLGNNDYALTGTYRKNSKKKTTGNGVYFARFKDDKIKYLSFFDYTDFEHFTDYLGEKRSEKIDAKIQKKKDKGKDVSINTLSAEHPAYVINGGLVFVTEYFYQTYRYEYTTKMVNGKMQTVRERKFDGFQYTHAMAIGINSDGAKLWDQHIPLFITVKPYYPRKFLKIMTDSVNTITTVHTNGQDILSSVIKNGEITNNKWAVTHNIEAGQKEKWTNSESNWWYGKEFFILEKQKTKEKKVLGNRKIRYYGSRVHVD